MKIDTSMGYKYYINILASILDNPLDSIHTGDEAIESIARAFNDNEPSVLGRALALLLEEPKEGKWEIVS